MKRGVSSLASIAATAPFVGFFGTVLGVFGSFRGLANERASFMRILAKYLSEALAPTALGLFVGVLAFCLYRYLSTRLENFDIEMRNASLELMDGLNRF